MIIHWKMKVMVNNFFHRKKRLLLIYCTYYTLTLFNWVERQVTDSQQAGMSQSYSQSETGITARYLKITLSSFGQYNEIFNFILGTVILLNCFVRLTWGLNWLTCDLSDQTLSWQISRLHHCDLMWFVMWNIAITLCVGGFCPVNRRKGTKIVAWFNWK